MFIIQTEVNVLIKLLIHLVTKKLDGDEETKLNTVKYNNLKNLNKHETYFKRRKDYRNP